MRRQRLGDSAFDWNRPDVAVPVEGEHFAIGRQCRMIRQANSFLGQSRNGNENCDDGCSKKSRHGCHSRKREDFVKCVIALELEAEAKARLLVYLRLRFSLHLM